MGTNERSQHERMHWDLKRDTTRPPAKNLHGQQRKSDRFQACYDEERPHDGIDGDLPCERWEPSPRPYPDKLLAPEHPSSLEIRRVSAAGTFRLKAKQPFLSNALADDIVYYRTLLGRIDERTGRITGLDV